MGSFGKFTFFREKFEKLLTRNSRKFLKNSIKIRENLERILEKFDKFKKILGISRNIGQIS